MEDYELKIKERIEAGEEFPERELFEIMYCYLEEEIEHESGRWTTSMTTIFQICGKFYQVHWERGLTENQEDEIWDRVPTEVGLHEEEVTITKREWRVVDEE